MAFATIFTLSFGAEWTAPDKEWTGKLIVVVRDRRGGIDWLWINVEVEQ